MKTHAIIPIFVPHEGCPTDCVFCNQRVITAREKAPDKAETVRIIESHLNRFLRWKLYGDLNGAAGGVSEHRREI